MDKILEKMEENKRDRVINGALEEFAKRGFDRASTNRLVERAGISKGLLFHYFQSKEGLYRALVDFSLQTVLSAIEQGVSWEEEDLLLRIQEVVLIKTSLSGRYPFLYEFLARVYEGLSYEELRARTDERSFELMRTVYEKNIDYSFFKEGLDLKRSLDVIRWSLDAYSKEIWQALKKAPDKLDMARIHKETDAYIATLRQAFYKSG